MTPDEINGTFEGVGALLTCLNVRRLLADKRLNGIRWEPTAFFMAWGLWNLYYYPSLDQWASFAGGCLLAFVNLAWLMVLAYCALDSLEIDLDFGVDDAH